MQDEPMTGSKVANECLSGKLLISFWMCDFSFWVGVLDRDHRYSYKQYVISFTMIISTRILFFSRYTFHVYLY